MFYLLIMALIWGIIWGCATNVVIHNKGYDDNWFWWGFLFGLIAFIVACVRPPRPSENKVSEHTSEAVEKLRSITPISVSDSTTLAVGDWVCACGRRNRDYVSTCVCGRDKNAVLSTTAKEQTKHVEQTEQTDLTKFKVLKEYKELLDLNIISQEEFDAKKAELLK